ncbi:MAG: hypothetical protein HKN04_10245, partial [Rhodothermaceae bacterium]|nr:hypothetical protein [Rhodothermaceae bacterium]
MEVFVALSTWLLIGLLLALAALGLVAVGWARSRQRVAASTTTSAYGDDLQSLGLSAVRTRSADAPSAPSEELTDEPWEDEISAPTAVARSPLPAKKEPVEEPVRVSVRSAQREEPEVEFDDLGVSSARPVTRPAAPEETSPAETPAEAAPPATDASESDEADAAETEDVEADEASKG